MSATILHVDDQENVLWFYRELFERRGYRVRNAQNGSDGINIFRFARPNLVLLDYHLGGFNGDQVAENLRNIDPSIPLVMLSGDRVPIHAKNLVNVALKKSDGFDIVVRTVVGILEDIDTKAS